MSLVQPVNTAFCLEQLCESNYRKLFKLIPNLRSFDRAAIGVTQNKPALYLDVLERNPYTLTIELTHCFNQQRSELLVPAVKIRIYLDAQLAEVIRDNDRPTVDKVYQDPGDLIEIRDYKWRLNYFLQKWLDHCLKTEYRFQRTETAQA
ncbi:MULTISPECIES: DUF1249 domain-containing protein [Methylomonas]|uniref:DUF1249 domain-containing protein n=1 Tax=Methylomonas koyamae TaxID=702114 RepID=A0A177N9Q2_9GAMM|nr:MULTISPECIES: DUF1249 domain-containing protein [Methylomonas]ANE56346.1 hypothetical protein AYM39_14940 [Methylomonas sp. DH-1]OAI13820.1 hypothetical protein A1507_16155 [Methylomonas koyamae]BBL57729.1 hypothetical protein MKFW12EY_13420 [Methylomonas koyamae]